MSSFDRRFFLIGAAALTGCGFTPSYSSRGGAAGLINNVEVEAPGDHLDYILVRELEDQLGRAGAAAEYALSLSVDTRRESMAITIDGRTNRFDLIGEATYALRSRETNEVVTSGKVDNFTSYSTSGTSVSTLAGETDAEERLMRILASRIVTDLQAFAATTPL